jgi:cytohesin
MKFKLAWDPFGPPRPSAIKRYVPTPNDFTVQWDAYMESLKDQAENGDENEHNCCTVSMMWLMYMQDSEAINAGTSKLTMTLHKAAYNGYVRTVKLLLDANADVNEIDDTVDTPLHLAACRGHVEVVKALLDANANVHVTNSAGHTPLLFALMGRHLEAGELLFAAGAVPPMFDSMPTESKLLHHAMCGRTDEVKELLAAGIDPDFAETGELVGSGTALHCAAEMGRPEIIAALLAAGARVDPRSDNGKTPLHLAAMNGHAEAVKALLAAGADVNAQTSMGATPLDVGLGRGKLDASRAICEAGGRTCIFGQPDGGSPNQPPPDPSTS